MSRLYPTKVAPDAEFQAALAVIQKYQITLTQAEKLTRAITISDEQSIWTPEIDDIADQFWAANKTYEANLPDDEVPYMPATLFQQDLPSWSAA